jgi:methyl-accepting chemotaxis protein
MIAFRHSLKLSVILVCLLVAGAIGSMIALNVNLVLGSREDAALDHDNVIRIVERIIPLNLAIKEIRYDVVQVQQFLTDYSATRGQDGLDDGPAEAAKYADRLRRDIAEARSHARALGLAEVDGELDRVGAAFEPYYAQGKRMAETYAKDGTAAGNQLMASFDSVADALSGAVDRLTEDVARVTVATEAETTRQVDHLVASAGRAGFWTLAIGGAGVLATIAVCVLLLVVVLRPLVRIAAALHSLAEGGAVADLGYDRRRDEIGAMARAVAVFRRAMEQELRAETERREAATRRDAERRALLADLAGVVETTMHSGMDPIVAGSGRLRGEADRLVSTMSEVAGVAGRAGADAAEARRLSESAAGLTATVIASVDRVVADVGNGLKVANAAVARGAETRRITEALMRASADIGDIVSVIAGIAAQTNLLALNASIESARAGDTGRGFAVVAGEVKALAGQTAASTERIRDKVAEIQATSDEVAAAIDAMIGSIDSLEAVTGGIAQAMETQVATTGDVARIARDLLAGAERVTRSMATVDGMVAAATAVATTVDETAVTMLSASEACSRDLPATVRSALTALNDRHGAAA